LQTAYKAAYEACKGDQTWIAKVIKAKADRIAKAKVKAEAKTNLDQIDTSPINSQIS